MLLSKLQRRNLCVNFCLENPNKTFEHFKPLGYRKPTIYRTIKRFETQEKVERKIGFGKKCAFSSSKARKIVS
jgi:hypothetical protein